MPLILDGTNGVNASTGSLNLQTGGTSAITIDSSQVATFSNAPTSGIQSTYSVRGLTGTNNSTTPNTQYDFSADAVVLINTNGAPIRRVNTGTITNNVSAAGAVANGRDQSGAFSSSSWIHFYFIWNGTTLATVSSATAPPTGPTLPSGYTHWAYIGAVRFNASSQLVRTRIRGSQVSVDSTNDCVALNGSNFQLSYASLSLSSFIPPNAVTFGMTIYEGNSSPLSTNDCIVRIGVDGSNAFAWTGYWGIRADAATGLFVGDSIQGIPNVSQTIYYLIGSPQGLTGSESTSVSFYVNRYDIPNGGE